MSTESANGKAPLWSNDHQEAGVVAEELTVVNEFTAVSIRKILTRNGERLEIESLRFDGVIRLDALALEGLTWQTPEVISSFLENPFGPVSEL